MSSPLSFSAACSQLGSAAYGVVSAAWRAPFTGGKIRMVTIGLPVLFITCATGATVFAIMNATLGMAGRKFKTGADALTKYFYRNKNVRPVVPKQDKRTQDTQSLRRRHQIVHSEIEIEQFDRVEESEPVIRAPLPANAAKERNEALLKFLELVDKYVIEPLIVENDKVLAKAAKANDPFLNEMIRDKGALRAWLRAITLWQLGTQWDQIEAKYVKMETPQPPTLASLRKQVQSQDIDGELKIALIAQIDSEEDPDIRLSAFRRAVDHSGLPSQKQLHLMGLSIQLALILHKEPVSVEAKTREQEAIRQKFAIVMHNGMAITLSQTSLIIEGWLKVIQQMSPHPVVEADPVVLPLDVEEVVEMTEQEHRLQVMVGKTSHVLSGELSEHYLLPLWDKQQQEWQTAVEKLLAEEKIELESPAQRLSNDFLTGKITEKEFLEAAESYKLSTSLTAALSFLRAIRCMQVKGAYLSDSIKSLPRNLLLQLQPMLVSTLNKTATMLSEISFERTVPKVVGYGLELLECCRAMQEVRQLAGPSMADSMIFLSADDERDEDSPLMLALLKGNERVPSAAVEQLYLDAPEGRKVTGMAVIKRLGTKAHKAVRLSETEIQERTWIRTTKDRLEGLLRVRAAEYTKEPEGQWLATLLQNKSNRAGKNLIGYLLSLQNKLWQIIPGMENIAKVLLLGIQTFVEEEGCDAIQKGLHDVTSTGFLSANIAKGLITGLLDISKEQDTWEANLPMLQQAFAFLQADEQELVIKHLIAQYPDRETFAARQRELTTPPENSIGRNDNIAAMKRDEDKLSQGLKAITLAHKTIKASETPAVEELDTLEEAYDKLKREKDLKQFERVKGLVLYVADAYLTAAFNFAGGNSLKQIVIAVIHEAYTLLSYQEVVKHWIFTIVDLLLDELEEASAPKKAIELSFFAADDELEERTRSLLEFIEGEQKRNLLNQLVALMQTSSDQAGWFSIGSWINWGAEVGANWMPDRIWGWIETAAQDKLRITPPELTGVVLGMVEKFATDPKGLSELVIDSLTEKVADPRPKPVIVEDL